MTLEERVQKFMDIQQIIADELGLAVPTPHGEPLMLYDIPGKRIISVTINCGTEIKKSGSDTFIKQFNKLKEEGKIPNGASIMPRRANERGGYMCMPMRKNIPVGRSGWKLVNCPKCGCECWFDPLMEIALAQGAEACCTECALRLGMKQ